MGIKGPEESKGRIENTLIEMVRQLQRLTDRVNIIEPRESGAATRINVPYGGMYQDDSGTVVTIPGANQDVIIDGFTGGEENEMSFQNNQEFKIEVAGKYKIDWSVSFRIPGASNQESEATVGVNGVRRPEASAHRKVGTGNDTGNMGATCVLDLAVDDLVQIVIRNESSASDITVDHANLAMIFAGT